MKAESVNIGSPALPLRYLSQLNDNKKLIVFLHGFKEQPRKLVMECDGLYLQEWDQLAYFAPFPIPRDENFPPRKFCYSWYFDSLDKSTVIIPVTYSIELLKLHLTELTEKYDEVVIVGFSQGAMLGLPLASHLPKVNKMISIAAWPMQFAGLMGPHRDFQVWGFHGTSDHVLNLKKAQEQYQQLKETLNMEVKLAEYDGTHHVPLDMPKLIMQILT